MNLSRRTLLKIPLAMAGAWISSQIAPVSAYGHHFIVGSRTTVTGFDDAHDGQYLIITGPDVWLNIGTNSFKLKTPVKLKRVDGQWDIIQM